MNKTQHELPERGGHDAIERQYRRLKRQQELPGYERRVIDDLDRACGRLLEAQAEKKVVAEEERAAEAECQELLVEHGIDHGYLYIDGETRYLITRKVTQRAKIEPLDRPRKKRRVDGEGEGD